jgi:[calcium/calmodulin-dependent protein kinase] kinase
MNHLMSVMKAFHKFKTLKSKRRAAIIEGGGVVSSPTEASLNSPIDPAEEKARMQEIQAIAERRRRFRGTGSYDDAGEKGHARDVMDYEPLFLGIGAGSNDVPNGEEPPANVVADSPTAVDFNVYDRAYGDAIDKIKANPSRRPTLYLTRFVKEKDTLKHIDDLIEASGLPGMSATSSKLADLVSSLGIVNTASSPTSGPGPEEKTSAGTNPQ